jgi:hypothetical protein
MDTKRKEELIQKSKKLEMDHRIIKKIIFDMMCNYKPFENIAIKDLKELAEYMSIKVRQPLYHKYKKEFKDYNQFSSEYWADLIIDHFVDKNTTKD